jgi:hypothetical protein
MCRRLVTSMFRYIHAHTACDGHTLVPSSIYCSEDLQPALTRGMSWFPQTARSVDVLACEMERVVGLQDPVPALRYAERALLIYLFRKDPLLSHTPRKKSANIRGDQPEP